MSDKPSRPAKYRGRATVGTSTPNGIWFLGFVGALAYFLHNDSGTFWLVILAILKAIVWPAILVYRLLGV